MRPFPVNHKYQNASGIITGPVWWGISPGFQLDRTNHLHLVAGTDKVYETITGLSVAVNSNTPTPAGGVGWYLSSGDQPLYPNAIISTVAIAPSDSDIVYVGTTDGVIFEATDANHYDPNKTSSQATYVPIAGKYSAGGSIIDTGIDLGGSAINQIAIDPNDPNHIFVATGNYRVSNAVFKREKDNSSKYVWSNITNEGPYHLPTVPANAIIVYPNNSNQLVVVVGTAAGIFLKVGSDPWYRSTGGTLPYAPTVYGLSIAPDKSAIVAFTHGRSAWLLPLK